ncbi:MAG: hypothetical protein HY290_09735, partial [Planctomycetia bacterium]|nr:hypothetical protein [Planctomycetia bacterium]
MAIALFVLGLVVAALAVWGTVRYINCKKKPSLRFLAGVALLTAALYLLSIGPASWLATKMGSPTWYTSG